MKKSLTLALFVVLTAAFMIACGGSKSTMLTGNITSYTSGKWVDNNTFWIWGTGAYNENVTNVLQRKRMAIEAAEIDAQYRALQKFKGAKLVGASGMKNFKLTGTAAAKEVAGFIRGGSVVKTMCSDKKNEGCQVIYEIKSPGLKSKVVSAFGDASMK